MNANLCRMAANNSGGNETKKKPSFGKHMRRRVSGREPDADMKTARMAVSPMLNPVRRRIFEFVCRFPGTSPSQTAQALGFSLSTLRWHLEKLMEGEFLEVTRLGRKMGIYPPALVPREHCDLLIILNGRMERSIMSFIVRTKGCTQSDVIEKVGEPQQNIQSHLKKLEKYEIVMVLKDGRYRRYYPGPILDELDKIVQRRGKNFRADFLEKIKKGGIDLKVQLFSRTRMIVELSSGRERSAMVIPFTPVASILSSRAKSRERSEGQGQLLGETILKKIGSKKERT